MKSKKIVIVALILLILVGGFIGYKSVKNYRATNILISLYNDLYVEDNQTYFINGKEVSRDETNNSNSYATVVKAKPLVIKSYNYRRGNELKEKEIWMEVAEDLEIDNYSITLSLDETVTCYNLKKCIANGNHKSNVGLSVSKGAEFIKLSKEDYQKTFNYMWRLLKRDYFDLLINYIAQSYNYPYSYDNFGYFKNFTFYLWDDSEINYKSIKLSEEEILKEVNGS